MPNVFELISTHICEYQEGLNHEDILLLEKEIGYTFPEEYIQFLLLYSEIETYIPFQTYTKDYPNGLHCSYLEKMYNKDEILGDLEYRIFLENSSRDLFKDSTFSMCLDKYLPIGRTGDYQTCFCIGVVEENLGRIFLMEDTIYLENKKMKFIPLANSLLAFFLLSKPQNEDWNTFWVANFGYYEKSDYIYSNFDIQVLEEKLLLKLPYHYSDIIRRDFKFPSYLQNVIIKIDNGIEVRLQKLFNYQDFLDNLEIQSNLIKNKDLVVIGACNLHYAICLGIGIKNHKFFYLYDTLSNVIVEEYKGLSDFCNVLQNANK